MNIDAVPQNFSIFYLSFYDVNTVSMSKGYHTENIFGCSPIIFVMDIFMHISCTVVNI